MTVSLIESHYRRDGKAKKRYSTVPMAEKAIERVMENYGHEMRMYHCGLCQGYHLSRRNKSDQYQKKP